MKTATIRLILIAITLCNLNLSAQPYTLDDKIKPLKLELAKHPKYKEVKYNEGNYSIGSNKINYHYIKGHDIYQFVDIFIFAKNGNPNLIAEIVFNTWNNIEDTKNTSSSENGIINFKVRSYQDIGFMIKSSENTNVDYSIIVNASQPIMKYLGSPFIKATEKDLNTQKANNSPSTTRISTSDSSIERGWWVYLLIGFLLLVVGLLVGKLMNRNKGLPLIIVVIFLGIGTESHSQQRPQPSEAQQMEIDERERNNSIHNTRRGQIDAGISRINDAFGTADVAEELILQYRNLGSCLGSGPPPGQPRIPSFCPDEESSCASCFSSARANFNRSRYNLEKLQTIYNCSRGYIDAAIAFGDNVSGYHGVVGLVWQSKKREIERSVIDLEKAYDKKRLEMLQTFHETLVELDRCEREHGMADWYDRFGVMFYNFVEMRYHR